MKRKLIMLSLSAFFSCVITGCMSTMHPFDSDHLTVTGTPAGFEEFFQGINGISQTAKNDDVKTLDNHHALQAKKFNFKLNKLNIGGQKHD